MVRITIEEFKALSRKQQEDYVKSTGQVVDKKLLRKNVGMGKDDTVDLVSYILYNTGKFYVEMKGVFKEGEDVSITFYPFAFSDPYRKVWHLEFDAYEIMKQLDPEAELVQAIRRDERQP